MPNAQDAGVRFDVIVDAKSPESRILLLKVKHQNVDIKADKDYVSSWSDSRVFVETFCSKNTKFGIKNVGEFVDKIEKSIHNLWIWYVPNKTHWDFTL